MKLPCGDFTERGGEGNHWAHKREACDNTCSAKPRAGHQGFKAISLACNALAFKASLLVVGIVLVVVSPSAFVVVIDFHWWSPSLGTQAFASKASLLVVVIDLVIVISEVWLPLSLVTQALSFTTLSLTAMLLVQLPLRLRTQTLFSKTVAVTMISLGLKTQAMELVVEF